jgi:hypothetical protein
MLGLRCGKEGLGRIADVRVPSIKEQVISKLMLVRNAQVYLGCCGDW